MPRQIAYRVKHALAARFPEQRLFLKTDTETRFIRLSPATQVAGLAGGGLLLLWTIVATSMLMIDSLGSGTGREQAQRELSAYETRLDTLSRERDQRAAETQRAHERYSQALQEVSAMQSLLLASEDRRREMETGLEVVQATLRRTIRERDAARAEVAALRSEVMAGDGPGGTDEKVLATTGLTLDVLADTLGATARQRDAALEEARQARAEAGVIALEKRLMQEQNDDIFGRLEKAMSVSVEPLEKMFRAAGLKTDDMLREVRRGYSAAQAPSATLRISTKGDISADAMRANGILDGLDRMALYRAAAAKAPFANPVRGSYRFTSGFGNRRDPKTGGQRLHAGTDFAGARGTPIHSTADGVVTHAGWQSGYGNLVTVRHSFGIETRYAHLSRINVKVGQTVSRGARIGDMGNTGRSTGTHLHYEVRIGGNPVNPMTYIKAARNVF